MLSIKKIEELLNSQNCSVSKIYTSENLVIFLEIINYSNHDVFILYIPSKYDVSPKGFKNVYEIKEISSENKDEEEPNLYDNIELDIDINDDENLKKNLEEKYNKELSLDIDEKDFPKLEAVKDQINRMKNCIKNTDYKLLVQIGKFIICLRRNDDIDTFCIQDYNNENDMLKLFIVTDLEMFYINKVKTLTDINTIQKGIIKLIEDLKKSHEKVFRQLIAKERKINEQLKKIDENHKNYNTQISNIDTLLKRVNTIDDNIYQEHLFTLKKYKLGNQSINSDIELSHVKNKYESKRKTIANIKKQLIETIVTLKNKRNNVYLQTDKLLFQNNILLNSVINNMKKISNYI